MDSQTVKSVSLSNGLNNEFLASQWHNKEGVDICFQTSNNNYFISISDLMFEDIINFNNSNQYFIDYDEKFNSTALKHHRLIILQNEKITLRIQNLYGEQFIDFLTLDSWNVFVKIIRHFS